MSMVTPAFVSKRTLKGALIDFAALAFIYFAYFEGSTNIGLL